MAAEESYAQASSFDRRTTVDNDFDDTEAEVTLVGDPWSRSGERPVAREDAGSKTKKKPDVREELLARRTASGVVAVASVKRAAAQAGGTSASVAVPPKVPRPTAAATFATAPTIPDASPSAPTPSRSVARPPALPTKPATVAASPPPPAPIFEPAPAAVAESAPPPVQPLSTPPPAPVVAPAPLVFTPIDPWAATAKANDVDVAYEEALRGMSRSSLARIALTALVFLALVLTAPFTFVLHFLASQWRRASAIVERRDRRPADD